MASLAFPSLVTASQQFGVFSRDLTITFPIGAFKVSDVYVTLRSAPSLTSGLCVNDLRLWLDSQELTAPYTTRLRSLLQDLPSATLENAYRTGVQSWWKIAQRTGDYDSDDCKNAIAQALGANASEIIARCGVLGNTSDKCRGNLHPLNFLYTFIALPPISLSSLGPRGSSIGAGSRFAISHGVPVSDSHWSPGIIGGAVQVDALLEFESPLSDLEQVVSDIESIVSDVYNLVVVNGPIYSKLIGINSAVDILRQQTNDCVASVGTPSQIAAINNTLNMIKSILHLQD